MQKLSSILQTPSLSDIRESHIAIQSFIHRTPILTCEAINSLTGAMIYFKCENFQKIGAFKMRGASNAAVRLSEEDQQKGLATHSSGNHAQAVARSAQVLRVPAYIVMPENAPAIKVAATKGYGAQITFCAPTIEARETTLKQVIAEKNATFIHPFNNYDVIAGQATAAKEIFEDLSYVNLDVMMAPVGGGGLMAGTALTTHYLSPKTQIIGAEPKEVDDAFRSLSSGQIEQNVTINTIADGLRTNLGPYTFGIIQRHVSSIITVSEEKIVEAMRLIWERMKIIIEPSCAVPLAAVLTEPDFFKNKKIAMILTGGNVDLEKLPFW